ncbi:hypothetical protein V3C99_005197, partial [Haemonchus contortus]
VWLGLVESLEIAGTSFSQGSTRLLCSVAATVYACSLAALQIMSDVEMYSKNTFINIIRRRASSNKETTNASDASKNITTPINCKTAPKVERKESKLNVVPSNERLSPNLEKKSTSSRLAKKGVSKLGSRKSYKKPSAEGAKLTSKKENENKTERAVSARQQGSGKSFEAERKGSSEHVGSEKLGKKQDVAETDDKINKLRELVAKKKEFQARKGTSEPVESMSVKEGRRTVVSGRETASSREKRRRKTGKCVIDDLQTGISLKKKPSKEKLSREKSVRSTRRRSGSFSPIEQTQEECSKRATRLKKSSSCTSLIVKLKKKHHSKEKARGGEGRELPNVEIPEMYKKQFKKKPQEHHLLRNGEEQKFVLPPVNGKQSSDSTIDYWTCPDGKKAKSFEIGEITSEGEADYGDGKLPPALAQRTNQTKSSTATVSQTLRTVIAPGPTDRPAPAHAPQIYGVADRPQVLQPAFTQSSTSNHHPVKSSTSSYHTVKKTGSCDITPSSQR